jgi:hypothetical protein
MRKKKYKDEDDDFGFEELIQEEEILAEDEDDDEENYFKLDSLVEATTELEDEEEEVERPKKPTVDKKKFYVDPKEFDMEIMNYYDSGVISNNLAEMISRISHKLSYASNFINYSYREEMVGDGVVRMMKALIAKKYDREKGTNPFSYFTRIAFNAFRNRIKKEKHIHETHEKYQEELTLLSLNYNNIVKNKNASYNKKYN